MAGARYAIEDTGLGMTVYPYASIVTALSTWIKSISQVEATPNPIRQTLVTRETFQGPRVKDSDDTSPPNDHDMHSKMRWFGILDADIRGSTG